MQAYIYKSAGNVFVVKWVSAFGAELRRMSFILRLPAAFVALVLGNSGRLFRTAVLAEFAFVHRTA